MSVANGSTAVWQAASVTASGETPVSGNVFVPKNPELFDDPATPSVNEGYDADGNQLRDGRWNCTWDAENRLVQMVANAAVGPQQLIKFEYDAKSRRIGKKVWNNTGGTGNPDVEQKFLYDDWNLVAKLNGSGAVLQSFLWGPDLSETPQGAGGVGGLLAVYDSSTINNQPSTHFAAYDGNGNLSALVSATDG